MIKAEKLDERLGYVGRITDVDIRPVQDVFEKGYIPVISTLGCDDEGNVYNINADTAAERIAGALGAESMIVMTDIEGILWDKDDPKSLLSQIYADDTQELIDAGVISGGMIPKVKCCKRSKEGIYNRWKNTARDTLRDAHRRGLRHDVYCGRKIEMNTKQRDESYIAHTYGRYDIEIAGGKGSIVWDETGKKYIDMATGIAVNSFGVADDEWISAVTKQLNSFQHTSNLYYTAPCTQLAQMLVNKTGMKRVFFSNSGAEANECAIKTARKYGTDNKGKSCNKIITLINSFHGRTITTLAATGQDALHKDFLPLTDGFIYVSANDIDALKAAMQDDDVCAVMFECVQGEGGVNPLDKQYVSEMAKLAGEKDILLVVDEVQTGNGRTGALYAYMNYGITPDIVSTAKGLGGGLPIGATLFGQKTADTLTKGTHGSTFGGNPVCCAGAISILSRIDDALLEDVREKSAYIFNELSGKPGIEGVSGMGLMIGLKTKKPAAQVVKRCAELGVLVITAHEKVRLLPALNIPMELVKEACGVIEAACAE